MIVNRLNNGAEHRKENRILMRIAAGLQQIEPVVAHRPVIVFAGTVDARKRFFVEQPDEPVFVRFLPQDFHYKHVMIARKIQFLEQRCNLVLGRRHFVVTRLGGNAKPPERFLHIGHKRKNPMFDGTEIVVIQLLMLRRRRSEQSPSGLHKVGTRKVKVLVDQKIFLLDSERDFRHVFAGFAETPDEPPDRFRQRLSGFQKRSLLIKRLARIGTECCRNTERGTVRVALDERGAGRIPGGITARFKRGAETAGGKTGSIRLADDQIFSGKRVNRLAVAVRFHECVVLFRGRSGQRLEPVGIMRGAFVERPAFHRICNIISHGSVQRRPFRKGFVKSLEHRFRKPFPHAFDSEHIRSELVNVKSRFGTLRNPDRSDLFNRIYSCLVHARSP